MAQATKTNGFLKAVVADLQMASCFLTRLPVGWPKDPDGNWCQRPLADTVWSYPLVGVLLGLLLAPVLWLATSLGLPELATGILAVIALVLLTGALHEDGLADVADGFGGAFERERKLEIMKDSLIGSYGAVALVLITILKASLIGALSQKLDLQSLILSLVSVFALSRGTMPLLMLILPYARNSGLASSAQTPTKQRTALGLFLSLTIAFLLLGASPGGVVFLCVLATVALIGFIAKKQIGGITGDVLGTAVKLSETVALIALTGLAG